MKKIIVTGGSGFIGSTFIKKVLKKKVEILNLDKLSIQSQKVNLKKKNYLFEKIDICNKTKLEKIINNFNPDYIVHFAAESHVDRSITNPYIFIENNIISTLNILEILKKKKNIKLLNISTDEVFGHLLNKKSKFNENSCYNPRSPYSSSKASSDLLIKSYSITYGIKYITSICSNNFGPYQHFEKLIPKIIINCIKKKPIPIYGNGLNIRDWIFVDDHCDALIKLLFSNYNMETFLIGGNNEINNYDLAKFICDKFDQLYNQKNSYKLITFVNDRPGHDFRYAINNKKTLKRIKWKPRTNFKKGIIKTIKFYKKNLYNINKIFNESE